MQTGILLWGVTLFCVIVFGIIVIMVPKLIDKLPFIKPSEETLYDNYQRGIFNFVWICSIVLFSGFLIYSVIDYFGSSYTITLEDAKKDFSVCRDKINEIAENYDVYLSDVKYTDNQDIYAELMTHQSNDYRIEIKLLYDKFQHKKFIEISYIMNSSDMGQLKNALKQDFVSDIFNKYAISRIKIETIEPFLDMFNPDELIYNESDNTYEYSEAADLGFKSNIALIFPADKSHMTFSVNGLMKK